jgi:enoyl-CoA hydratase/carnithine racemase
MFSDHTSLLPWPARVALSRLGRQASASARRFRARTDIPPVFHGDAIGWSLEGQTLEVVLHREPCNEIGSVMLRELEELADYVKAGAGGARALLFYSTAPRGFSAGADLRELYTGMVQRRGAGLSRWQMAFEVRDFLDRIHEVFDTFDTAPITTIAVVHGFCFGGGFELALTCDEIIAEKSTRFAFPELRLGLVPGFGGIPRLRRDLGNAVVRDLLLTGRSINASKAGSVGLVSQVVPRGRGLEVARKVGEQAAKFDRATTAAAKRFAKPIPRAELRREKDLFIELMGSPVVEAALKKFVESDDAHSYLP